MSGIGEHLNANAHFGASLTMATSLAEFIEARGIYHMQHLRVAPAFRPLADSIMAEFTRNKIKEQELLDRLGELPYELLHEEDFKNTVMTLGKNLLLDTILGNSAAGAVVMGLKGTGTQVAGDTQASHAGWLEVGTANAPAYSGTRKTPAFSAASAGSKTTSAASAFTFTSGGNVFGGFINIGGSATQDNTTGTLFSAGDFSSSRTVVSTDVLNVSYTLTV